MAGVLKREVLMDFNIKNGATSIPVLHRFFDTFP